MSPTQPGAAVHPPQRIYVLAAKNETALAAELARPLTEAGYEVVHDGTVKVGDSLVETATRAVMQNTPVVLCGTPAAVGTGWAHQLVNASRAGGPPRVFVVQMDEDAYVKQLSINTVVARYCDDPAKAVADLLDALRENYPARLPAPAASEPPAAGEAAGGGRRHVGQFLDEPSGAGEFDHDAVAAFRDELRDEVRRTLPAGLTAKEFLSRTGLWTDAGLTRAGALLFGPPNARSMVKCTEYFGVLKSDAREPLTFEEPLAAQIVTAHEFVSQRVRKGERPAAGSARSEVRYDLPMIAVREIIANAVVHRDYTRADACIHVRLFADRLVVSSPGTWPGKDLAEAEPLELAGLEGESVKRNFQLARVLTWTRLVEGEGSGIPTAVADCRSESAQEPTVSYRDGFVHVTLRRKTDAPAAVVLEDFTGAASDHELAVSWAAPPASVTVPTIVGVLPRTTDGYLSRPQEEAALSAALADGRGTVLSGMGGTGKTQLAARMARSAWDSGRLDLLVWVRAFSRDSIVSGYAEAARAVVPGVGADDPEAEAMRFLGWLQTSRYRWLVVLDDVADPADLRSLWPPTSSHGSVLLTTRRRDAALTSTGLRHLAVGLFHPRESVGYLSSKLADTDLPDSKQDYAVLAARLGHLPLALSQAATYLIDRGISVREYVELLDDYRRLQDVMPDSSGLPDDQREVFTTTWALSIDRADRLAPVGLARPMMQLVSVLSTRTPVAVLTSEPVLGFLGRRTDGPDTRGGPHPAGTAPDERDAEAALRALSRLALVSFTPRGGHVDVHGLVQRATRESLSTAEKNELDGVAADALMAAWPEIERDAELGRLLRAGAQVVVANGAGALWQGKMHELPLRLARSIGETMPARAVQYLNGLRVEAEQRLGPDAPDVLRIRHLTATFQAAAGDTSAAVAALEALVADSTRVLGRHSTQTISALNSLGWSRGESGDFDGAVDALTELVVSATIGLGSDHLVTLSVRHALATWLGAAGRPAEAGEQLERILADRLRLLGPDHPDTFATRNNLAQIHGQLGDVPRAVTTWQELLTDQLRVIGPDHPDTFVTRNNLASALGSQGEYQAAAALQEALLQQQLYVLGPDHPDTLTSRNNLASWRGLSGEPVEAARMLVRLLADRRRVLRADHPDVEETTRHLAGWLGAVLERQTVPVGRIVDAVRPLGRDVAMKVRDYLTGQSRVSPWALVVDRAAASEEVDMLEWLVEPEPTDREAVLLGFLTGDVSIGSAHVSQAGVTNANVVVHNFHVDPPGHGSDRGDRPEPAPRDR